MKKLIWILIFGLIAMPYLVSAVNCTMNNPSQNQFDNGIIVLNVTGQWGGTAQNITNVTWTIGNTNFSNSSANGTRTTSTSGDFTFTLVAGSIAEGTFITYATCYNSTDASQVDVAVNSTRINYTEDTTRPQVVLNIPLRGSIIVPVSDHVTIEYTPTDTNFGKCSLHIDNVNVKSNTAITQFPNVSSGRTNRFTQFFGGDNTSVRIAIQCRDLAGNVETSSNYTFGILTGAINPAIKKARAEALARGNAPSIPRPFAGAVSKSAPPRMQPSHLQQFGWIYVLAAALVIIVVIARKYR